MTKKEKTYCKNCKNEIKGRKRLQRKFCSKKCYNDYRMINDWSQKPCLNCKTITKNPKFCSKSCCAKYYNRIDPKRQLTNKCYKCSTLISSQRKYCKKCSKQSKDMTLKEAIYKKHHPSSAYALIRCRARTIMKKLDRQVCEKCGYSKHVQIAHKKSIASYPKDTLISVINHVDNLIPLCPNCHWEMDHQSNTS